MEHSEISITQEEVESNIKDLLSVDLTKFKLLEQKPDMLAHKKYDVSLKNF